MAVARFEHADEARAGLSAIVSDPAHGADALNSPETIANLLGDFLPDAPREAGLLVAAVKAGIPTALADHAAQGMDVAIAVHLAAESMAARTAYTSDACEWAASELAIALAATTSSELTEIRRPGVPRLDVAEPAELPDPPDLPDAAEPAGAEHRTIGLSQSSLAPAGSAEVLPARFGDWKRLTLVLGTVVLVLVAVAAFGAAYLTNRRSPVPVAGSRHSTTSGPGDAPGAGAVRARAGQQGTGSEEHATEVIQVAPGLVCLRGWLGCGFDLCPFGRARRGISPPGRVRLGQRSGQWRHLPVLGSASSVRCPSAAAAAGATTLPEAGLVPDTMTVRDLTAMRIFAAI